MSHWYNSMTEHAPNKQSERTNKIAQTWCHTAKTCGRRLRQVSRQKTHSLRSWAAKFLEARVLHLRRVLLLKCRDWIDSFERNASRKKSIKLPKGNEELTTLILVIYELLLLNLHVFCIQICKSRVDVERVAKHCLALREAWRRNNLSLNKRKWRQEIFIDDSSSHFSFRSNKHDIEHVLMSSNQSIPWSIHSVLQTSAPSVRASRSNRPSPLDWRARSFRRERVP